MIKKRELTGKGKDDREDYKRGVERTKDKIDRIKDRINN